MANIMNSWQRNNQRIVVHCPAFVNASNVDSHENVFKSVESSLQMAPVLSNFLLSDITNFNRSKCMVSSEVDSDIRALCGR